MNDEGLIYAKMNNVSLLKVKEILQDTYKIKLRGDDQIYQSELTMSFDGLSLDRALKRIFHGFNFIVEYNSQGMATEVTIFSHTNGFPGRPRQNGNDQILSNNFKEIYAKRVAELQTLDHIGSKTFQPDQDGMIMPEKDIQEAVQETFEVQPNISPEGPAAISPSLLTSDGSFKIEHNVSPSGKNFKIFPSAPPSRKK